MNNNVLYSYIIMFEFFKSNISNTNRWKNFNDINLEQLGQSFRKVRQLTYIELNFMK